MTNQKSPGWTSIEKLEEPYNDAFNYRTREQKDFFNKLFLRTDELRKCLAPATYYVMGEKGTGKTAYAIYLANNSFDNTKCQVITMTETQYRLFMELKRQGKLEFTDYSKIWRSMLLYLVGRMIAQKGAGFLASIAKRFDKIEALLDQWEKSSQNPELEIAFEAVRSFEISGKVGKKDVADLGGAFHNKRTEAAPIIRHSLLDSETKLRDAIAALNVPSNHVLFIDGIDFRPESVGYRDYLECVKGLGEAVWQLNSEFFGNIRDSKGRIKVVLLIRPDVFHSLNLYNSNSRLQDNAVLLDWSTTENEYDRSRLFEVSGRYFAQQQHSSVSEKEAWEHYYELPESRSAVFRHLLKTTFQKPRDVLTFIKQSRAIALKKGDAHQSVFPSSITHSPALTRQFSDYLLGEVRNYAAFYMPAKDFESYLKFFQYLNGRSRFSMKEFANAHAKFKEWARGESIKAKDYLRDPEALLQLLYDVNVVGYSEPVDGGGATFYHWSYREKSLNNIAPKVKSVDSLLLNPGIAKAVDIGKEVSVRPAGRDPAKKNRSRRQRGKRTKSPG